MRRKKEERTGEDTEEETGKEEEGGSEEGVEGKEEKEMIASPRVPAAFQVLSCMLTCASHLVSRTMRWGHRRVWRLLRRVLFLMKKLGYNELFLPRP